MHTVTHTISTTVAHTGGRDWVPIIVQVLATLASTAVAAFAIWLAAQQNRRTLIFTARQVENDERKLRADLYDRRYEAWNEAWAASDEIYKAILVRRADGPEIETALWIAYNAALSKIVFLFGDDTVDTANHLLQSLQSMNLAKVAMMYPPDGLGQLAVLDTFTAALNRAESAKIAFRKATRKEIGIVEDRVTALANGRG